MVLNQITIHFRLGKIPFDLLLKTVCTTWITFCLFFCLKAYTGKYIPHYTRNVLLVLLLVWFVRCIFHWSSYILCTLLRKIFKTFSVFFSEHAKETLGTNHVMNYSVFLESTDGNQNNDQPNDKYTFVS